MPENPRPALDSEWLAGDGRRMRVVGFTEDDAFGQASALVEVLDPIGGMRRRTRQALENFGGFLKPAERT